MKGYLIVIVLSALGGLVIGTLDGMTDRTLATAIGLTLLVVSFVVASKWVDKR